MKRMLASSSARLDPARTTSVQVADDTWLEGPGEAASSKFELAELPCSSSEWAFSAMATGKVHAYRPEDRALRPNAYSCCWCYVSLWKKSDEILRSRPKSRLFVGKVTLYM
jgi:hypothetical protein